MLPYCAVRHATSSFPGPVPGQGEGARASSLMMLTLLQNGALIGMLKDYADETWHIVRIDPIIVRRLPGRRGRSTNQGRHGRGNCEG